MSVELNKDDDYIEWSSDSFQAQDQDQALWQSNEVTEIHIWREHSFHREDTNSQFSYLWNVSMKKKNHDSVMIQQLIYSVIMVLLHTPWE